MPADDIKATATEGSIPIVEPTVANLSDLMKGVPDDAGKGAAGADQGATGGEDPPTPERRARARKDGESPTGAEGKAGQDPEPEGDEGPDKKAGDKKPDKKEPSEGGDKDALIESYQKGIERLKGDQSKMREALADLAPKAQLYDKIQTMLRDPEGNGVALKILLETAAELFDGDVGKALAGAGYRLDTSEPEDPVVAQITKAKEELKAAYTDEFIEDLGWNADETEMVRKTLSANADMIFDRLAGVLPTLKAAAPAQAQTAPKAGGKSASEAAREIEDAVAAIQEDVPSFKVTDAEARKAVSDYPGLPPEEAIRYVYRDRVAKEKDVQENGARVPAMVTSNGKTHGASVLDPAEVDKGFVSLTNLLERFKDVPPKRN